MDFGPERFDRGPAGRRLDVTVVLLDDGLSSTMVMPVEIFHSAGALWSELHGQAPEPRFRVLTASRGGRPVRSPYGLHLQPEGSIESIARSDIVIVPTSGTEIDGKLEQNAWLPPWLKRQHEAGAYVAGVCMGAMYLAEAGLLDGRPATTRWAFAAEFARRWPAALWRPELMVTEEARVLCSGGVHGSVDISLYLVEKLCGHEVAVQCAKALLLDLPRTSQSGYAVLPLSPDHRDDKVRAAEAFLKAHLHEDLSVAAVAAAVGLGARTLVRRFKAATGRMPGAYLQALRIELAKAMLERDGAPIQSVSEAVGYEDAAFFRSLFKRSTGMTPAQYRARFGPSEARAAIGV